MASESTSSARLILAFLKEGRSLTTEYAAAYFGISRDGVRARISELYKAGYAIRRERTTFGEVRYSLGRTNRFEVAAGRLLLDNKTLYARHKKELRRLVSLV